MPKNKRTVEEIKADYPAGCRVELVEMKDKNAPPPGMCGTVRTVDDIGTIHINWDNGQGLGIVEEVDTIVKI